MNAKFRLALLVLAAALTAAAPARAAEDGAPTPVPVVNVSATSSATVPNDRLHAWLRVEAEHASAATAAAEVNQKMTRALPKLRALPDAQVSSAGYTTQQVAEKGRPVRWRVVQSVKVDTGDFAALGDALGRLQAEDGLLLSGMSFALSEELKRRTQDAITQQAIASWRSRAQAAAQGFGYAAWRTGRVHVQTQDGGRPMPMMRASSMAAAAEAAPVPMEAGSTDVSVTVSGEAILEGARPATR